MESMEKFIFILLMALFVVMAPLTSGALAPFCKTVFSASAISDFLIQPEPVEVITVSDEEFQFAKRLGEREHRQFIYSYRQSSTAVTIFLAEIIHVSSLIKEQSGQWQDMTVHNILKSQGQALSLFGLPPEVTLEISSKTRHEILQAAKTILDYETHFPNRPFTFSSLFNFSLARFLTQAELKKIEPILINKGAKEIQQFYVGPLQMNKDFDVEIKRLSKNNYLRALGYPYDGGIETLAAIS
jgi:hypothetical protein